MKPEEQKIKDSLKHGTRKEIESPWRIVWRRFRKNKLAVFGFFMLLILALSSIFAPYIAPYSLEEIDWSAMDMGPSKKHILGTDILGRDIFSRLLYAGRISLTVGLVAQSISIVL